MRCREIFHMIRQLLVTIAFGLTIASSHAQDLTATLVPLTRTIENAPVRIPMQIPVGWDFQGDEQLFDVQLDGETTSRAQFVPPNFQTESIKPFDKHVRKDLVFIAKKIEANSQPKIVVRPLMLPKSESDGFRWRESPNGQADLMYLLIDVAPEPLDRRVLRYIRPNYDASNPDVRNRTYKVFHHVFDPAGNGKILTNGGHTDDGVNPKDMVFPHHRGLMFGVNKCTYDGKTADTWHCTNGVHVSHNKTIHQVAGPVLGEHRVLLDWVGPKDDVFAQEERQMTAYKVPGGTLIEFASRLTPKVSKVKLDGDPQHAGFQFRAHNDVAKKTAKETYYLRPDGKGKLGETRNWDPKNKGPVDLPWNVLSFVLDGKRYSVEYIDHPKNPGEKRYSERDYGRFGCYFEYDLTPENPLVLNHRIWVQEGEMTAEQAQKLRDDFVNPPTVKNTQ